MFTGLAEIVRQACGRWAAVAGGGLGVLAAAYYDGCLTQKQCIQVAYTLSSIAGCWIDDLERSMTSFLAVAVMTCILHHHLSLVDPLSLSFGHWVVTRPVATPPSPCLYLFLFPLCMCMSAVFHTTILLSWFPCKSHVKSMSFNFT